MKVLPCPASRLTLVAGMASYLDAGALVASGLAIGGFYVGPLGLSGQDVGLLLGLQTFAFAIGALIGGRLGDRLGRRRVLVSSLIVYALGVAVLGAAHSFEALVVGVVFSGLAIGGDLPASLALVAEEAPRGTKARRVALTHVLWVSGIAVVGLLGLALADLGALAGRVLYVHLVVVAVIVLLLRLRLPESAEWIDAKHSQSTMRLRHPVQRGRASVFLQLGPAPFLLGLYYACWTVTANTLGQFKPYLWIDVLGGTPRGASVLILVGIPVGLVLSSAFLLIADARTRRLWMGAGSLVCLSGWASVAIWPARGTFVFLAIAFVVGASVHGEVAYKIWSQELIPTLARTTVQGITMAVARVCAAGVAVVTPAVASASPRALFSGLLAASVVVACLTWWWLPKLERRRAP